MRQLKPGWRLKSRVGGRHALVAGLLILLSGCPTPREPLDGGADGGPACPEFVLTPPVLDFGCVARGDTVTLPFPDAGATPGAFTSAGFTLDDLGLHFAPLEAREYSASIPLFRGACPLGTQRVIGSGVSAMLFWSPPAIDFGYVRVGLTAREVVTFSTCSSVPLTLSDPSLREGTSPSPVFGLDAGSLVIPGATRTDGGTLVLGELAMEVGFSPSSLGPRAGALSLSTPITSQPLLSISLRGAGGGPLVQVTPTTLDFGVITMPTTQLVTIRNVGSAPQPPDLRANLFLGVDGMPPYFELSPGSCGVVTMSSYDPAIGLRAAGSDFVTLSVELQPAPGPRSCTLHVFSTDPLTPDAVVAITAG